MPLAHRLNLSGEQTNLIVWKHRFEKAWGGSLDQVIRGSKGEIRRETLDLIGEQVREGQVTLITDVPLEKLGLEPGDGNIYGGLEGSEKPLSALRIGGWFDGSKVQSPHLLVADMGAWPGGMGPDTLGGLTLVFPNAAVVREFMEPQLEVMSLQFQEKGFRGLFSVGLSPSEDGFVEFDRMEGGWGSLHTYAFLSELENFPALLEGSEVCQFTGGVKYVTVVPVTIPPWPNQGKALEVEIGGLTPTLTGKAFWFDVCMNGQLKTAGLDGFIAVARGAAGNYELAKARALEIAAKLDVPEKQFRPDVGVNIPLVISTLEQQFGIVI
ncbi:MAG: hypothetical protein CME70_18285 [Halobacteriovorax sp.]|nr:hypothetical protein [Halobacteriovorax sp.]